MAWQNWRERFRKVILAEGYSERAAEGILEEYFWKYYNSDLGLFDKMLKEYEARRHEPIRGAKTESTA